MTLQQLALEYEESARLVRERLTQLREQLRTARGDDALALRRRVEVLSEELGDTLRTARWLHDYYC